MTRSRSNTTEESVAPAELESPLLTPSPSMQSSSSNFQAYLGLTIVFALVAGYKSAVQPDGAGWRFFSYHPFLMVFGFVGMMGAGALTKKLGGYTNTKLHGILASSGLLMAYGGLYVIYRNKELLGKEHITTTHAIFGILTMAGATMAAIAGGLFLHPDFGIDKTNRNIRFAHKWFSRSMILSAWITCALGLSQLTSDNYIVISFIVPLLGLLPVTLI